MNIPDEVIEAVTGMHPEQREYPDDVRKDFHSAAEWARKEALRPVVHYLNHCRFLRTEPTTTGLSNALAEASS